MTSEFKVRIWRDEENDFLNDFLDLPEDDRSEIFEVFAQLGNDPYSIAIPTNSPNLGEYYTVAGNKAITFTIYERINEVMVLAHHEAGTFLSFLNPPK